MFIRDKELNCVAQALPWAFGALQQETTKATLNPGWRL